MKNLNQEKFEKLVELHQARALEATRRLAQLRERMQAPPNLALQKQHIEEIAAIMSVLTGVN